jgi:alkylated DNA repair protein alkB family protein 8
MTPETQQRLLDLNRAFYATVAVPFDGTRMSLPDGMTHSLHWLPSANPLTVLDVGCGNGRFAWALETLARRIEYTGLDADETLLTLAHAHAERFRHVQTRFLQTNIAGPGWATRPDLATGFDAVVCLATLHHFPGYELRRSILRDLANLLATNGRLIVAAWQFLLSPRLRARQMDWAEVGLRTDDVEPGDALLPWKQGVFAIRYVHQIDAEEMRSLAQDVGLTIVASFRADGEDGDLNLYWLLEPARRQPPKH